jgi:hypothetical protein
VISPPFFIFTQQKITYEKNIFIINAWTWST